MDFVPFPYIFNENARQSLCKYHPYCKYAGTKCKFRHFLLEGEEPRKKLCRFNLNCTVKSCPLQHTVKEFCPHDTACEDPRNCGKRHTVQMTFCREQFVLPQGYMYEDICKFGNRCRDGDHCKWAIHYSCQEMIEMGWVIMDSNELPCGWNHEIPCEYWHIGDSVDIQNGKEIH